MNKVEYNWDALIECKEFNAADAVKNFSDRQAYFDKLTEFSDTWHDYLYLYNPTVVIYSEDVRSNFLSDMEDIRKIAASLEMTLVVSKLNALDEILKSNDAKSLTDGLRMFYAALNIEANSIAEARLPTHEADSDTGTLQSHELPLILTVDDKPELLTTISSVLRSHYKVIAVTSGNAALKAIETHTPALFLLDIEMPGMNGYELAKKIREHSQFNNTPIIFFTSKATREYVLSAVAHGGNDYLVKPVDSSLLLGKIQHHLKG